MDKKAINYSPIATVSNNACIYPVTSTSTATSTRNDHDRDDHHGEVLGASTTVPAYSTSTCGDFLHSYLQYGRKNDTQEVKRLQHFLNNEMHANLPETGYFGGMTQGWVKKYQVKYRKDILGADDRSSGTGYVYKATLKHINTLCRCKSF